VFDQIKLVMI